VKRTRVILLILATVAAMLAMAAPSGAAASQPTPRWVLHTQRFSGGISNGVRAMVSPAAVAARARHLRASGTAAAPALANVQMNDDSNPPLPQNETAVAYNTRNPLIAVAASNDYVSGGVAIMRTANGGQSWRTTRVTPQFLGTRDFCSGGDPAVAYSHRDRAFYISQLCFFRALPFSEIHVIKSVDNGKTWTPGRQAARAASNYDYTTGTVDDTTSTTRSTSPLTTPRPARTTGGCMSPTPSSTCWPTAPATTARSSSPTPTPSPPPTPR
jgi:hypothetical protein